MNILCVDVGNTNTKFCAFRSGEIYFHATIATDKNLTWEQYAIQLKNTLDLFSCPLDGFRGAAISSVVPQVTHSIEHAIKHVCGMDSHIVTVKTPTILGELPSEIGADIICAAVCAANDYTLPAAIFSLGTATTVFVLDQNKRLQGGLIIPGIMTSLNALSHTAASLPQIYPQQPDVFLGEDTISTMNSGIMYGTATMIDGLSNKIRTEYGDVSLILCGGMSSVISKVVENKYIVDENIVLKGLNLIYGNKKD